MRLLRLKKVEQLRRFRQPVEITRPRRRHQPVHRTQRVGQEHPGARDPRGVLRALQVVQRGGPAALGRFGPPRRRSSWSSSGRASAGSWSRASSSASAATSASTASRSAARRRKKSSQICSASSFPGAGPAGPEHWGIPGLLWIEQRAPGTRSHKPVEHAGNHLKSVLGSSLDGDQAQRGDALIARITKGAPAC